MRKILKYFAVAALSVAVFSCQKEDGGQNTTIQDQYAYMDAAGEEALSQIEPADFQRLGDLVANLPKDSIDLKIDEDSEQDLISLVLKMTNLLKKKCVINFNDISGTFTLQGDTLSYSSGSKTRFVYVTDNGTWTADLDVTTPKTGFKEVKLGQYEIKFSKISYDLSIYLAVPTSASVDVSDDEGLYMGCTVKNIDCSEMSDDWTEVLLSQLNASCTCSGYINGKGHYRVEAGKVSMAKLKATLENGKVYGNNGQFLASADGCVSFTEKSSTEGLSYEVNLSSLSYNCNLLNKITSKNNAAATAADIYLDNSGTAQLSVAYETGNVTFADGSVKPFEEVFNETNFPKSYTTAVQKYAEFIILFGIDF